MLITITSFYFQRPCLEGSHLPSKTISALDDRISDNRFLKSSHDDKYYVVLLVRTSAVIMIWLDLFFPDVEYSVVQNTQLVCVFIGPMFLRGNIFHSC